MIDTPEDSFRPIFVLGSPRSGTTAVGALLGTHPEIAHFGEYFAFYFSTAIAGTTLGRIPSSVRERYLNDLRQHAGRLAATLQAESGRSFFCDSTPWNALIAPYLAQTFPRAAFVVTARHYIGVIQSLKRSYDNGFKMTADSIEARAALWAQSYKSILALPTERIISLDYDALCEKPEATIDEFLSSMERVLGTRKLEFDIAALATSHANQRRGGQGVRQHDERAAVVRRLPSGGLIFAPRENFDLKDWSHQQDLAARSVVMPIASALNGSIGTTIASPFQ